MITKAPLLIAFALSMGCSKDQAATVDAAASAAASASAAPSASVAAATPTASASAAPEVQHDCPKDSTSPTGTGSFGKPCEAKGKSRMVELSWNGKYDDKGAPSFRTNSKAPKTVFYGRLAIYFYDKAGKQIDVKETTEGSDKSHAFHTCSGNVFSGGLNAGEKAAYNFSCMTKSNIPDGMASMEAEAFMVGFADSTIKKNEFYWRNMDLAPEARPKGGVK